MTTIAFDGKFLVSDSSVSVGDEIQQTEFRKIYTPEADEYWDLNGVKILAFALTGPTIAYATFRKLLREGLTDETTIRSPHSYSAIAVDENGLGHGIYVSSREDRTELCDLSIVPTTGYCSIGSGDAFAMALMAIGKTARQAVKHAIRLDVHSHGNLQTFEVPEKPLVPSKRPVTEVIEVKAPEPPPAA